MSNIQRIIHDLVQGSDEWKEFRATHYGASEAVSMLGMCKKTSRDELLDIKHRGFGKEFSEWLQKNILDKGHEVEAKARIIVEKRLGVDLFPVTMSYGKLSASCDGLSMDETIAWENKQYNKAHFEQVKNGELPEIHWPQCQQVLHVTGAEKLYFTISDGTEENTVGMWVYPDEDKITQLVAGWIRFESDLHEFVPTIIAEPAKAQPVIALPSLSIAIKGEVTSSNLEPFKIAATAYLENINTNLVTDQDFADGEAAVKFCKDVEEKIELTKSAMIAQTSTIDEVMRELDFIKKQYAEKRLALDKLVKNQKAIIKADAIAKARSEVLAHSEKLDAEIAPLKLWASYPDFASAIIGLKSLKSMHSTLNDCVAKAKIDCDAMASDIRLKVRWFHLNYSEHELLFADLQLLIQKPMEDFQLHVKARVDAWLDKVAADKARIETPITIDPAKPAFNATVKVISEPDNYDQGAIRVGNRPSAKDIIRVVATAYQVSPAVAEKWLIETAFEPAPF
jgi:predicted phage-related endonuclease